jgi:hypothetical protein
MRFGSNRVEYQPLGVVGIISPCRQHDPTRPNVQKAQDSRRIGVEILARVAKSPAFMRVSE